MSANEGRTHSCEWKKVGRSYRCWLTAVPAIVAESEDFDECRELLAESISRKFGDIDPILEFASGYPHSIIPDRYAHPRYVWIGRNTPGHLAVPIEAVFSGGYCGACRRAGGERTTVPIRVKKIQAGSHGLNMGRLNVAIYSKQLLEAVGVRQSLEWSLRPIESDAKARSELFEIQPADDAYVLRTVAVRNFGVEPRAWRCAICMHESIHYKVGYESVYFVAADSLPNTSNGVFILDGNLCVPSKLWIEARSRNKFRDVYARQLGVVSAADINEHVLFDIVTLN